MYFIVKIPLLSWRQVIQELDYPEFNVPSREGLQLLFTACHRGLMEIFPVDVLYRSWTNTEGQVLFCLLFVTFSTVSLSFPCSCNRIHNFASISTTLLQLSTNKFWKFFSISQILFNFGCSKILQNLQ